MSRILRVLRIFYDFYFRGFIYDFYFSDFILYFANKNLTISPSTTVVGYFAAIRARCRHGPRDGTVLLAGSLNLIVGNWKCPGTGARLIDRAISHRDRGDGPLRPATSGISG